MGDLTVTFEPLFDDTEVPQRATDESAGFDLHAYVRGRTVSLCGVDGVISEVGVDDGLLTLPAGAVALVPLGFKARLPAGHEAQIRMRSSWAFKYGLSLPNAPGTIDADFPDEWMVMMRADRDAVIAHGDRIAQAVITRYATPSWTPGEVTRSSDRSGGFGSTG